MQRYVHHQLMTVVEAACAVAINAAVVFGVSGPPKGDAGWQAVVFVIALAAVFGALVFTGSAWLGGERRDFESAVPLASPETVLPAPRESLRHSFEWAFVVLLVAPSLVIGLIWESWVALWPLVIVIDRLARGAYGIYWERRHGLLLWRGNVPDQPLGKGQHLYSSVWQPTR